MSAKYKGQLYALRKAAGTPTTPYRNYTVAQLTQELTDLGVDIQASLAELPEPEPKAPRVTTRASQVTTGDYTMGLEDQPQPASPLYQPLPDPNEMPGQRLNTKDDEEIIRIDDKGRAWLQEEVRKPAFPKPRGRRILKYIETGVRKVTNQAGEYVEEFEIAGNGPGYPAEVKITLPSYQVGIYRDPRFPFKIHCYDGREGFDFFEVNDFYGGAELVPDIVKRVYVENELCYEIRSVIRAINEEHRQLMLTGRIK